MKRILCFGDSNTWGLIPGTDKRFADGVRWTSIIRNDLEQSGYDNRRRALRKNNGF